MIFLFSLVAVAFAYAAGQSGKCTFSEYVFVLDESQSITIKEWGLVKEFTQNIVKKVGISPDGNRAAVASFSDKGRFRVHCSPYKTTTTLLMEIEALTQQGEYTNLEDGLIKGRELLETNGCGKRDAVFSKVMILLTDGIPNITPTGGRKLHSLLEEAKHIRSKGVTIVAIGVGDNVDFDLLRDITGDKNFVYSKHTYVELTTSEFINELAGSICTDPVLKTSVRPFPRTLPHKSDSTTKEVTPTQAIPVASSSSSSPKPSGPPTGPTRDPDTGFCRCNGIQEMDFPALKMSVFDIDQYPGASRKEKVTAAVADIVEQRKQIKHLKHQFDNCKNELRHTLLKTIKHPHDGKELFLNIDECTVGAECKLPTWVLRLEEKKCKLEDELRWYGGTFGRIYDYGENAYNQLSGVWK